VTTAIASAYRFVTAQIAGPTVVAVPVVTAWKDGIAMAAFAPRVNASRTAPTKNVVTTVVAPLAVNAKRVSFVMEELVPVPRNAKRRIAATTVVVGTVGSVRQAGIASTGFAQRVNAFHLVPALNAAMMAAAVCAARVARGLNAAQVDSALKS
jgi:hypothetical protein